MKNRSMPTLIAAGLSIVAWLSLAAPVSAAPPEPTQSITPVDATFRDAAGDLLLSDGLGTYDKAWSVLWDVFDATTDNRDRFYTMPSGNRSFSLSHEALGGAIACDANPAASYPYFTSSANPNWLNELEEVGSSTTGYVYIQCLIGQHSNRRIRAYTPSGTDVMGNSFECATATRTDELTYTFEVGTAEITYLDWPAEVPPEVRSQLPSSVRTGGCAVSLYEDTRASHRDEYTTTFLGRFSAPLQITATVAQ